MIRAEIIAERAQGTFNYSNPAKVQNNMRMHKQRSTR
jgi:hypothetical protein